MNFRITGLDGAPFQGLFALSDEELARQGARRTVVDSKPGFPCRVSLEDAEIGETVVLVNFEHQPADTPYRSHHAVYVRQGAREAQLAVNEVPESIRSRLLSVRAYDLGGSMVDADVTEGSALEPLVARMLGRSGVAYLHVHNARPGCYAARVDRA